MRKVKDTKERITPRVLKTKKGTIRPIAPFKTLEEEANFWDTHSFVDRIDEGTIVGFHTANKSKTITVRFKQKDIEELRRRAFRMRIGPTTLARIWITERLQSTQA